MKWYIDFFFYNNFLLICVVNIFNFQLQCCGDNSPNDWRNKTYWKTHSEKLPDSCCTTTGSNCRLDGLLTDADNKYYPHVSLYINLVSSHLLSLLISHLFSHFSSHLISIHNNSSHLSSFHLISSHNN
jgi:hypothetical protein